MKVVLRAAFAWSCPDCQITNFAEAVGDQLTTAAEPRIIASECGYREPTQSTSLPIRPAVVECRGCGYEFDVAKSTDDS